MAHDISQLLECQICSEPFDENDRKPKILPCHHTFCLQCMRQMVFRSGSSRDSRRDAPNPKTKLKCPNDNKVFDVPLVRNVLFEYLPPNVDVTNFPNDLTMMSLLSIAAGKNESTSAQDDITKVLIRRVKYLRREITRLKADLDEIPLSSDVLVEEAKRSICKSFEEIKDQFIEAIDEKQTALMIELDSFSEKRKKERNEQVINQFKEATELCDKVERELPKLTERKAIEYLERCLEMKENTKSKFDKLESFENTNYEVKFKTSNDSVGRMQNIERVILTGGQLILSELKNAVEDSSKSTGKFSRDFHQGKEDAASYNEEEEETLYDDYEPYVDEYTEMSYDDYYYKERRKKKTVKKLVK